jgi:hypothetical protein
MLINFANMQFGLSWSHKTVFTLDLLFGLFSSLFHSASADFFDVFEIVSGRAEGVEGELFLINIPIVWRNRFLIEFHSNRRSQKADSNVSADGALVLVSLAGKKVTQGRSRASGCLLPHSLSRINPPLDI